LEYLRIEQVGKRGSAERERAGARGLSVQRLARAGEKPEFFRFFKFKIFAATVN